MLFGILNNLNFSGPLVNDKRFADHVSSILDIQVEQNQCQHGDDEFCDAVRFIIHIASCCDSALFIVAHLGIMPTFVEKTRL